MSEDVSEEGVSSRWRALEPIAWRATAALVIAAVLYAAWQFAAPWVRPFFANPLGSKIVVLDVVRLANAQRMVAATFIKQETAAPDAAVNLMAMQKSTRDVVQRVAGRGTLVLVKQAVVAGDLPDITDTVLKELGLPMKAPTQDPASYVLDEAPTNLGLLAKTTPRRERAPLAAGEGQVP